MRAAIAFLALLTFAHAAHADAARGVGGGRWFPLTPEARAGIPPVSSARGRMTRPVPSRSVSSAAASRAPVPSAKDSPLPPRRSASRAPLPDALQARHIHDIFGVE